MATIEAAALRDTVLTARVISIGTKADYALQYNIELSIDQNPGNQLRAGMVASAIFQFEDEMEGPVIPKKAIAGSTKSPEVYLVQDGKAILKSISIAETNGELVKVTSGLVEGDQLIVTGLFNIQDGMEVRIIE